METYKVNNIKDMEQFKDEYGYKIDGNLEINFSLNTPTRLLVTGYIDIKDGWSIEAGDSYGISAELYIYCKGVIKFGRRIFAGICTWKEIDEGEKTITCGKLEGGSVEYGILKELGIEEAKVKITCEGKTVEISRESAKALNLI